MFNSGLSVFIKELLLLLLTRYEVRWYTMWFHYAVHRVIAYDRPYGKTDGR